MSILILKYPKGIYSSVGTHQAELCFTDPLELEKLILLAFWLSFLIVSSFTPLLHNSMKYLLGEDPRECATCSKKQFQPHNRLGERNFCILGLEQKFLVEGSTTTINLITFRALIFIDEIDALGDRNSPVSATQNTISQVLTCMDGITPL